MIAQLNHPGRQTNRFVVARPVAPSAGEAVSMFGLFGKPRELTTEQIAEIIDGFGRAAALCEQAGLDGVQVHAAHGYLLAQFLSPHVNRRTDDWGGDVASRARALVEAVRAARSATSPGFTVAVKLNSSDFRHGGFTEDDAEQVVRLLVAEGIDLLEISGGTYENPALLGEGVEAAVARGSAGHKEAYFAAFASRARAAAPDVPIMLTGGIRTRAAMEELLGGGAVDLIGLGRPLAIDPSLPATLLGGGDGTPLPRYTLPTVAGLTGESEWYETQIGRLGDGRPVDPGLRPVRAAAGFVGGELCGDSEVGAAGHVWWPIPEAAPEAGPQVWQWAGPRFVVGPGRATVRACVSPVRPLPPPLLRSSSPSAAARSASPSPTSRRRSAATSRESPVSSATVTSTVRSAPRRPAQ